MRLVVLRPLPAVSKPSAHEHLLESLAGRRQRLTRLPIEEGEERARSSGIPLATSRKVTGPLPVRYAGRTWGDTFLLSHLLQHLLYLDAVAAGHNHARSVEVHSNAFEDFALLDALDTAGN